MMLRPWPLLLALALPVACAGPDSGSKVEPLPDVPELGGSRFETSLVYEPLAPRSATDLAFNPERPGELWVTLREFYEGEPCTDADRSGCDALGGWAVIVEDARVAEPVGWLVQDPNAWHFMRRPTSIAFGPNDTFATCHEARTGNWEDSAIDFIGPTLWSSDPEVFAIELPGRNGSHLDMLHATPFCMGIAHDSRNAYFAFNGQLGAIDHYLFHEPHVPGGDDHSDGEMYRYVEGQLARLPEVPSHMQLDTATGMLYIADTGNGRVVRLDTASGTVGGDVPTPDPMLGVARRIDDAELQVVVPADVLEQPSGLSLRDDVLFVSDHATSRIHAFTLDGGPIASVDTGLPQGTLAGIELGPDGRLYFVDMLDSTVRRIELAETER